MNFVRDVPGIQKSWYKRALFDIITLKTGGKSAKLSESADIMARIVWRNWFQQNCIRAKPYDHYFVPTW